MPPLRFLSGEGGAPSKVGGGVSAAAATAAAAAATFPRPIDCLWAPHHGGGRVVEILCCPRGGVSEREKHSRTLSQKAPVGLVLDLILLC